MQLTGHKTEAVYRRYAITCEADLREGVARLNNVDRDKSRGQSGECKRGCQHESADFLDNLRYAGVAELADAQDLKSWVPQGACGFDSRPRHQILRKSASSSVDSAMPERRETGRLIPF